ncbi:DUF4962 domain-containing protein [Carboxylicivirga sp. M1479]|uniref:DUF4962 domain-containing protein n=1 Tax=Carboxylicivirga sp. M1479 TaxID=2594476 RepID=UPI0011777AC3|nr:DUF4962 domain-containing protein [Carboxylicivirga sp. M1479]TRX66425.1 DUF4962 domain-containing protein [Carboxylicivirga sp. M1479]
MNLMKIRYSLFASIALLLSITCWAQDARQYITKNELMPLMRMEPSPQSGQIDLNAPWLYWAPVVASKSGHNSYRFDPNYLYQCRISRDSTFQDATTITSPVKEWTLFNPHTKLDAGKWYWQYANIHKTNGKRTWSQIIAFDVKGNEREFVIPSFQSLKNKIGNQHPRIYCSPEQIGYFDMSAPGLKSFLAKAEKLIGKTLPPTLVYDNEKVLDEKKKKLSDKDYHRFLGKRTKEKYRSHARLFDSVIKAWLLTGDQRYQQEAMRRYAYLKLQYSLIIDAGAYNDFTEGFYINITTQMFDVFYDHLSADVRQEIISYLSEKQEESYHHILHRGEVFAIDNHLWQHHFRHFFMTSLALINHTPEADKWLWYVYEVWSMRAPVGSRNDGGWVPDNGYFSANTESLIAFPVILSRLTGVNYFNHPWYQNSPRYMFYTSPVGHVAGGFGDLADIKSENNLSYIRALSAVTNDSYGQYYSQLAQKSGSKTSTLDLLSLADDGNLYWFAMQMANSNKSIDTPQVGRAACFEDVGMVTMHSNIKNTDENLMLAFRSSPYGLTGHAHASQNAFNIQYGGQALFFKTGYYSSFVDPHSTLSYRHTRSHNSILANGIGQTMTPSSFGWIARFATGENYSYALGDASNAYSGQLLRDFFVEQFQKWDIEITEENGFGHPGVTTFRRHISLLDDNIIVIYDELEAKEPVEWSWLLNGRDIIQQDDNTFFTENKTGKGLCHLFSKENLKFSVTDTFFSPANDWLGNGAKRGIEFKNHWHGVAQTDICNKTRYLAIIQVGPKSQGFDELEVTKSGSIQVNGWSIQAELDSSKPAELLLQKSNESCISFGDKDLVFNGKNYQRKIKGSTLILENDNKEISVKELIDNLPSVAVYY